MVKFARRCCERVRALPYNIAPNVERNCLFRAKSIGAYRLRSGRSAAFHFERFRFPTDDRAVFLSIALTRRATDEFTVRVDTRAHTPQKYLRPSSRRVRARAALSRFHEHRAPLSSRRRYTPTLSYGELSLFTRAGKEKRKAARYREHRAASMTQTFRPFSRVRVGNRFARRTTPIIART